MLYTIKGLDDELTKYLSDDPVRPTIPKDSRLGKHKDVFVWKNEDKIEAITCVSYQTEVPTTEGQLFEVTEPHVAIFYTIWSYVPGAGRKLLRNAVQHIKTTNSNIDRFVTLSPKTRSEEHTSELQSH